MSLRTIALTGALALATVGIAIPSAFAAAPNSGQACFATTQWHGWRSPSPSVIYVRVNVSDVYRFDLSAPAQALQYPEVHIFSEVKGSDWICSPLDLQLWVVETGHGGIREPLFVKSITRLTPEEVRAIPPEYRP